MWSYLAALLASAGATVTLLVTLLLRFIPHDMLISVGLACHAQDDCATALPASMEGGVAMLVGGILAGLLLFAGLTLGAQLVSTRRQRLSMMHLCERLDGRFACGYPGAVLLADDPSPVSYTVGFIRPRVVISTGLLDALDEDEVRAVLAHEEGHIAGRDGLVVLAARTVAQTFAFLPGVRAAFAGLRRAQEAAADDYARRRMGDGLVVASSLQKFARSLLAPARAPMPAVGFADEGNVTERIRGLLHDEVVLPTRRYLAMSLACLVVVFSLFVGSAAAFSDVTVAGASGCAVCHAAGGSPASVAPGGSSGGAPAAVGAVDVTCAH